MVKITFNEKKYYELKLLFEKAVEERRKQFVFEGNLMLTSYAKYLLEHLRNQLNIKENQ